MNDGKQRRPIGGGTQTPNGTWTEGPPRPDQGELHEPPNRRRFLYQLAAAGVGAATFNQWAQSLAQDVRPLTIDNPLGQYPNRDWEQVYRDLYHSDSSFTFLCAPNDTHNCLLRAHVSQSEWRKAAQVQRLTWRTW